MNFVNEQTKRRQRCTGDVEGQNQQCEIEECLPAYRLVDSDDELTASKLSSTLNNYRSGIILERPCPAYTESRE
jgi:hypothetical protein